MIRPFHQLARAIAAGLFSYSREREAQRAYRELEDNRRRRLRELPDDQLLQYARMWGGEVCWPELRRRRLPVPNRPGEV